MAISKAGRARATPRWYDNVYRIVHRSDFWPVNHIAACVQTVTTVLVNVLVMKLVLDINNAAWYNYLTL